MKGVVVVVVVIGVLVIVLRSPDRRAQDRLASQKSPTAAIATVCNRRRDGGGAGPREFLSARDSLAALQAPSGAQLLQDEVPNDSEDADREDDAKGPQLQS